MEKKLYLLIIFNATLIYKSKPYKLSQRGKLTKKVEEDLSDLLSSETVLIYTNDNDDTVFIPKPVALAAHFIITSNIENYVDLTLDTDVYVDENSEAQVIEE